MIDIRLFWIAIATPCLAAAQTPSEDPSHEGDWYVSDTTNNNTGEREVYAFTSFLEGGSSDYVTLTMRCSKAAPIIFFQWQDVNLPDQTVLTIGPVATPDSEPVDESYVFERSPDPVEGGFRATPATSLRIIAALGRAKYSTISVRLTPNTKTVGLRTDGTQRAWSRVAQHCPVRIATRPPL